MDYRRTGLYRLLTVAVLLVCSGLAAAQEGETPERGTWAMQFAIDRDFDLESFQGTTLSFKKHTSPGACWRLGMTVDMSGEDAGSEQWEADSLSNESKNDLSAFSATAAVQRVWYVSPLRRTSFYWGGGPTGSVLSSSTESQAEGSPYRYETSTSGWGLGFTGVLGVEWYVAKCISLLAEYSSDLRYDHRKQTSERLNEDDSSLNRKSESTHDTYGFTSTEVKLGVAIYF